MVHYIIIFLFFILAFSGFLAAIHFSQYKKRPSSGCCGGGHCSSEKGTGYHSCYSEKIDFVENFNKAEDA